MASSSSSGTTSAPVGSGANADQNATDLLSIATAKAASTSLATQARRQLFDRKLPLLGESAYVKDLKRTIESGRVGA